MAKRQRIFILSIIAAICSGNALSQDCSSPITLCSEVAQELDANSFSGPFNEGCFTSTHSIFFEFTTNNNTSNPTAFTPYAVDALITTEECEDAGVDLLLTAAIFQPVDPLNPCGALNEIATCVSDFNTIALNSGILMPNTSYFLVLGTTSATPAFSCDFEIELTGAPLEIDACCDNDIALGQSADLQVFGATSNFGVESYVWAPSTGLDDFLSQTPVATPSQTTVYMVEGSVGDCLVRDEVTINVSEALNIFEIFSPNGDGINETWKIGDIENFDSALITVFDRWGQEVFKSIGYQTPWDGTNDGKRLSSGTYYYVIELNSLEVISEPIVGFVVIVH